MKLKLYILTVLSTISIFTQAQDLGDIPIVYVNKDVTTHFTSKLNIDYADISTNLAVHDLPMKNILRVKPKGPSEVLGFVTIVAESLFMQFKLEYTHDINKANKRVDLDNPPLSPNSLLKAQGSDYNNPNYSLDHMELNHYAALLSKEAPSLHNVVAKEHKVRLKINNIWVVEDYIYIDYVAENKANIPYTIDEIRYKIIDTKKLKATNQQDRHLTPDFSTNTNKVFTDTYRNIVAFRKFTFPDDKSFVIVLAEEQISGRKVSLELSYADILNAKTFHLDRTQTSK